MYRLHVSGCVRTLLVVGAFANSAIIVAASGDGDGDGDISFAVNGEAAATPLSAPDRDP